MQKTENSKAVPFVCLNCKTTNVGWQGVDGLCVLDKAIDDVEDQIGRAHV